MINSVNVMQLAPGVPNVGARPGMEVGRGAVLAPDPASPVMKKIELVIKTAGSLCDLFNYPTQGLIIRHVTYAWGWVSIRQGGLPRLDDASLQEGSMQNLSKFLGSINKCVILAITPISLATKYTIKGGVLVARQVDTAKAFGTMDLLYKGGLRTITLFNSSCAICNLASMLFDKVESRETPTRLQRLRSYVSFVKNMADVVSGVASTRLGPQWTAGVILVGMGAAAGEMWIDHCMKRQGQG